MTAAALTRAGRAEALNRVRRAARKHEAARVELEAAMLAARKTGASLRPIAAASGFSYEWTRRLLMRGKAATS